MNNILKNDPSPVWKLPENVTVSTGSHHVGIGNIDNVDWNKNYDWSIKTDTKFSINPDMNKVEKKHSHYFKDVSHLNEIDVYRVIELFGVVDPCLQHALKKLLVTGGRDGNKSKEQDVKDVIASCNRWLEMQAENKK